MNSLTLGLIAAFCWAVHDVTVRKLSQSVPLLSALLTVLFVGGLFQLTLVIMLDASLFMPWNALVLSVISGFFFLVAGLCLYFAFQRGPVQLVSPIIAAYPILSLVYASFGGASVNFGQALAVLAIVAGVGVVGGLSGASKQEFPAYGPTIFLSVLSAFGFASTFWVGQIAAEHSGELGTTLIARVVAFVVLLTVMLVKKETIIPSKKAYVPLTIMGILDGIALLCVLSAGGKLNPEYASISSSMFGLLTVLLAVVFLRERVSAIQWVGVLLAFCGIGYLAI